MAHLVAAKNLLIAQINLAWTDVAANGVYLSNELLQIDFESRAKAGLLPICVLDFRQQGSHEYGGDLGRDLGPVWVYRVVKDSETIDQLIGKAEALRNALWGAKATLLAGGVQILTYPTVEFHADQMLQRFFFETMKPLYCASVMLTLECGE